MFIELKYKICIVYLKWIATGISDKWNCRYWLKGMFINYVALGDGYCKLSAITRFPSWIKHIQGLSWTLLSHQPPIQVQKYIICGASGAVFSWSEKAPCNGEDDIPAHTSNKCHYFSTPPWRAFLIQQSGLDIEQNVRDMDIGYMTKILS